ncbi:hypothetical protein SUGI_0642010 [Cryptomeria japonica]|nr:hypothetical protein SUGI_0642010 [Cryptomeria japonica]
MQEILRPHQVGGHDQGTPACRHPIVHIILTSELGGTQSAHDEDRGVHPSIGEHVDHGEQVEHDPEDLEGV